MGLLSADAEADNSLPLTLPIDQNSRMEVSGKDILKLGPRSAYTSKIVL